MKTRRRLQEETLFDRSVFESCEPQRTERHETDRISTGWQLPSVLFASWPSPAEPASSDPMVQIGLAQYAPNDRRPEENVAFLVESLMQLRKAIVVVPEFFLGSYTSPDETVMTRREAAETLEPLRRLCESNELSVVGSLPIRSSDRWHNNAVIIDRGITRFSEISKTNLFGGELDTPFHAGRSERRLSLHSLSVIVQICMDIVDPLPSRAAVAKGARAILGPAAVSVDYLRTIHSARSLENQAVSIFCNRVRTDVNGVVYLGRSAIFFPDGTSIDASGEEDQILMAKVDMKFVVGFKKKFGMVM